ncbi:unnamed protein product [Phytophthora lilii]|uniref:Unnamed protein product n=1 Tax=Phytophthora lilii TaxID=2077276 RepID=A0A9W6TYW1_9STRA|nr:unnamed protein product [Phytophthora lilii]
MLRHTLNTAGPQRKQCYMYDILDHIPQQLFLVYSVGLQLETRARTHNISTAISLQMQRQAFSGHFGLTRATSRLFLTEKNNDLSRPPLDLAVRGRNRSSRCVHRDDTFISEFSALAATSVTMDSPRAVYGHTRKSLSTRSRFPEIRSLNADNLVVHTETETKVSRSWSRILEIRLMDIRSVPWCGWLFVYTFVQFCFSVSRCLALKALVNMYGSPEDYTVGVKSAALSLGFLEDFVCTTYFTSALWIFDTFKHSVGERFGQREGWTTEIIGGVATFAVSWLLFVTLMAPFVADLVLVLYRDMRFTLGLLATLIRERHYLKAAPISSEEVQAAYGAAAGLVVVGTFFALVRTWASWSDLALWNPTRIVPSPESLQTRKISVKKSTMRSGKGVKYVELALEEGDDKSPEDEDDIIDKPFSLNEKHTRQKCTVYQALRVGVVLMGLVVVPSIVVAVRCVCSPLVAFSALNATLNELLNHAFQPAPIEVDISKLSKGTNEPWVEKYIDRSELHDRFGDDTLFRRTTGFIGDLAFDVKIDPSNPPNVLVIGVESFRYRDSRYLVGDADPSNLFEGTNMTITPNFDRWAKRGVALRNIWSSIPTSRSLESILFAQIPYNSNVKTGITGGKKETKLSGLPQLYKEKGYETYFTTGSSITLDNWNIFLRTHGYDVVWDDTVMTKMAERNLNISREEWHGEEHRGFGWGVHDDLSFQLLGDLLVRKARMQKEQQARGDVKKPLFLTHYTISSHEPYESWPTWYSKTAKPDFSALYKGKPHADRIQRYLNVRYFTDMELGKFMDRMQEEGVLNDTIVVIVGDHGQAPEIDNANLHEESVTRVPAAIIAEGRLGDAVGLVLDDAAEQYDILNTLADITGLPEEGFLQTGVGRSLKRKIPFGERAVFSNDPMRKMSIVRGHQRLRYDAVTDAMMLHDTEMDYHMTTDLLPFLSPKEQDEWKAWRDYGRRIASYYVKRWDEKCLLAIKCRG